MLSLRMKGRICMKFNIRGALALVFALGWPLGNAYAIDLKLDNTAALVYFSPQDHCSEAIVKEIANARATIFMQAYTFNSQEIAAALLKAQGRGVFVEIILDKSNRRSKSGTGEAIEQAGVPTYIDARHAIANNKIMIIDGGTVMTGSFNFTEAAKLKNAENLLIIRNKELAAVYQENWAKHKEHAVRYDTRPIRKHKQEN